MAYKDTKLDEFNKWMSIDKKKNSRGPCTEFHIRILRTREETTKADWEATTDVVREKLWHLKLSKIYQKRSDNDAAYRSSMI